MNKKVEFPIGCHRILILMRGDPPVWIADKIKDFEKSSAILNFS